MINLKNISVNYGTKQVLKNLNLTLETGQIHGLLGLNGSGKTTLFNAIYGLKKMKSGEITINNNKLQKKNIAYLETVNYFYPNITGEEYLSLFINQNFDIKEWNKLFGLPLNKIIETYSTGMKKKLSIFGILKLDKSILILDEPFNGLDLETSRTLKLILLKLKEAGKTIIISSHILEFLTNLCDKLHYLKNGVIQFTKEKNNFETIDKEIFAEFEENKQKILSELL